MNFRRDYKDKQVRKAKKDRSKEKVSVKGQNIVITGRIPGMTRAQAENFIHRHGGHFQANISSHTTLLINGDTKGKSTVKLSQAQKLGIQVITPNQIAELKR